jgi:calcium-dependent protein kinase
MEDNQLELFRKIRVGEYVFLNEDWKNISEEAKDLIRKLLRVDPLERLTARGALRQPWILEADDNLSSRDLSDSLIVMRERRGRLKSIAKSILWFNRDRPSDPTVVNDSVDEASDIAVGEVV